VFLKREFVSIKISPELFFFFFGFFSPFLSWGPYLTKTRAYRSARMQGQKKKETTT
jgi:hypothetical protein